MSFANMKLAHRFAALLIILVAGFAIYGFWSFRTINHLKVNGPVYEHIVQGKDLIADILPPPEYIIESYLVTLLATTAAPAERKPLFDNLKTLKKDYDTRRAFWIKEDLEDTLKEPMNKADKSAQEFYQLAFSQLIPALEKEDNAGAATAFSTIVLYLLKGDKWPDEKRRASWKLLIALGAIALTAAAFLRWLS